LLKTFTANPADPFHGTIVIGLFTSQNQDMPHGTTGSLINVPLTLRSNAPLGGTQVNLRADNTPFGTQQTKITQNGIGTGIVISPAPTNNDHDSGVSTFDGLNYVVDGTVTVQAAINKVFVPATGLSGNTGSTVVVPVNFSNQTAFTGLDGISIVLGYDNRVFDASTLTTTNVQRGTLLSAAWTVGTVNVFNNDGTGNPADPFHGTIVIGLFTSQNQDMPAGSSGSLVTVPFSIRTSAPTGPTQINVRADNTPFGTQQTKITQNGVGTGITLNPAPTNGATDAGVDGTVTVNIVVNQPPFNHVPDTVNLPAPQVLFNPSSAAGFHTGTANTFTWTGTGAISVTDTDAGNGTETTTLTLTGNGNGNPVGVLNVSASGAAVVTNNGTASVTISGNLTDLNTTLATLTYTPGPGYYGTTTLTVTTNDNGNTGAGGAGIDTRSTTVSVVGLFISEIFLNRASNTTLAPNQYLEIFSTVPNYTIPAGVFLVGIEGDNATAANAANNPGLVQDIFLLSNQTTGTNGYLVYSEKGNPVLGAGVVDGNGNYLPNSGTGNGFGNGGAASKFGTLTNGHNGQAAGTAARAGAGANELQESIELGSESFLLIQAPAAPTTAVDIDAANSGTPGGTTYNSWNVMDGVGILDTVAGTSGNDRSYAPVTFQPTTGGNGTALAGSTVIATANWTATYVARIGKNTGVTSADWLASVPTGVGGLYTLSATQSTAFAGQALNHVAGPNYWAPRATVMVNDGSSSQHSQVSELTVSFSEPVDISDIAAAFVVKDAQNNPLSVHVTIVQGTDNGNNTASGVTLVVITFNADATHTVTFASPDPFGNTVGLKDGNFFLNIDGSKVSTNGVFLDTAHNGNPTNTAGTEIDEFWRLFGDQDGNRTVDDLDYGPGSGSTFEDTLGSSSADPNYLWYFDFNLDGHVNSTDDTAILANMFRYLAP
jgi:hypothetical protein